MILTDTHTHLYLDDFDNDRDEVIEKALQKNVHRILLPNIDRSTTARLNNLVSAFPDFCFPMMGLHPTSVNNHFEEELQHVENELRTGKYYGVGEIGIDLYWDKTFAEEQKEAFRRQLQWAKHYKLPVSIHMRHAFSETLQIVKEELTNDLTGVFHCFTGSEKEAQLLLDTGFKLGIGGIVTFKNSKLADVVAKLPTELLVLETDAPYLTPVPYRGKRNQSAYLTYIAQKIADIKQTSVAEIAAITTATAEALFFNHLKK